MSVVDSVPRPSTLPNSTKVCSVCSNSAIYTCPGCSAQTCSAKCSSLHKTTTHCSGVRNRTAYVSMNQYGFGTLMDDYTYLEDVGRKAGEWGKTIVQERLVDVNNMNASARGGARGRGRGGPRGRGNGRPIPRGKADIKRESIKRHLDLWDIEVEMLPIGMEKAKRNKSIWDFKTKKPSLTVEICFHDDTIPPGGSDSIFSLLTHNNKLEDKIVDLIRRHVKASASRKADAKHPDFVQTLVLPSLEDPEGFVLPECYMPALGHATSGLSTQQTFFMVDINLSLSNGLRNSSFVEYPTLHIFAPGMFKGVVVDRTGSVTRVTTEERPAKRQRVDTKTSKKVMKGLLGGYGSDDEDADAGALAALEGYQPSDEENEHALSETDHIQEDADFSLETGGHDDLADDVGTDEDEDNAGSFSREHTASVK